MILDPPLQQSDSQTNLYTQGNNDDEDEFDCQKHSKNIFTILNKYKTNLDLLEQDIKTVEIPSNSQCKPSDVEKCLNAIAERRKMKKKAKALLWHEKGFSILSEHFLKRAKGEKVGMDFVTVYDENNIGKKVDHGTILLGKYDDKHTALLLIIKNSDNCDKFLNDSSPFCAVSFVEAKKGNHLRAVNTIVFSS